MRLKSILLICLATFLTGMRHDNLAQKSRGEPRRDNYYELRAKYSLLLEKKKQEAERRPRRGEVLAEDLDLLEFERWDRYLSNHLYSGLPHEPGKIADMPFYLRQYFEAARRARRSAHFSPATPPVCPSAGLGNWTSMGPSIYPAPIMGKVTSVYASPANPNTAYAGAAEGGLFKTVNNGTSWTSLTDPSHYPALGITSIAVHPTIPTTIYIATRNGPPGSSAYGFGILKSTNGGTTWQEIFTLATFNNQTNYSIGDRSYVSKIMLHPQDPNTIYAIASHYVFRSTDAGTTWQKVMEIVPPNFNPDGCGYPIVDIDIINGSSGVADSKVLVSTQRFAWLGIPNSPCGPARAFISTMGGAPGTPPLGTFAEITGALLGTAPTDRIAGAVQPGNTAEFFVAYENMNTNHVALKKYNITSGLSSAVGTITSNGVFQLGAGYWDLELDFSKLNANTLYIAGTTAYRISLASGFSYAQISSYWATNPSTCVAQANTHGDIRAMAVGTSAANDLLLLGTDGGIHKAVLNPATPYNPTTANWDDLTGPGLAINEFFDINGMQSAPYTLVSGTQDNGTFKYNNGNWEQAFNYDGWQGTMNQATGMYFGLTNGGPITGLATAPGIFSWGTSPAIGSGAVVSDPNNPAGIYAGGASVYKSANFGASWTTLAPLPGTTTIRTLRVAPSNSNVIYAAREGQTWNPSNLANHLFRSSNGGGTWTDIGINLPPLAWAGVYDIAVDPDNENRVWVSFNGYWPTSNTSINGANRVYYSGDGGSTWSDFTFNMLAFPVATLIYQSGSDDVLYAGTDVGVFRYNKSLQSWECFSDQLPVVPVTRLEINDCKSIIRAATGGRGVYESDLPALPSEVVSTSVTWSGIRYLSNDLTIAPGATLTLTGTLNMSKGTVISVQRGATLNINGGTITNACGDMWHGIEVWGTSSAAQNLAGAQGKVIVQNGAKIENAEEAIITGRNINNSFNWSYTGGIVQASNSTFSNNRRSVGFLSYHWMSGPNELNNLSYFKNCTFETTRLLNEPTLMPYAHISLHDVKNVAILGCKFHNTSPTSVLDVNHRGDGIVSADAQYTVDDLMNTIIFPATLIAPSVFNGLTYGVRADFTMAGVNKWVRIRNSDFNNVLRGVQIAGSSGSAVDANNFNAIPNALTTVFGDATWGSRMSNAIKLSVRGNTFTGATASYQNNYGVIIDNCGNSAGNLVKGNTLKDLYTGIQALGNNGSGANGVQFRCNVFQPSMSYQLAVQMGGTLADQGNACLMGSTADNTFFVQASPAGSQINSPTVAFTYFASGTVPTNTAGPVTVTGCTSISGECNTGGSGDISSARAGLHRTIFAQAGLGKIYVNLPDDLSAGDIVTGTIFIEAEGSGDQQNRNFSALERFAVRIGEQRFSASNKTFKLSVPPSSKSSTLVVEVLDRGGRPGVAREIPILAQQPESARVVSIQPYGQIGGFITIPCPCDGLLTESDYVKVNGKEVLVLAESPRQRIAYNTSELAGPTKIEISEGGKFTRGEFRNIAVKMTASKLNLQRGERATLRIEIQGLENLRESEEITIRLTNNTPNIVALNGGDQQEFAVHFRDVLAGGIYVTERTLVGITAGTFAIDSTVTWEKRDGLARQTSVLWELLVSDVYQQPFLALKQNRFAAH